MLDANILLRAVIGRRVGKVIGRYAAEVGLFAPDTAFLGVEKYWRHWQPRRECR